MTSLSGRPNESTFTFTIIIESGLIFLKYGKFLSQLIKSDNLLFS